MDILLFLKNLLAIMEALTSIHKDSSADATDRGN
jgi:hypothetical protein